MSFNLPSLAAEVLGTLKRASVSISSTKGDLDHLANTVLGNEPGVENLKNRVRAISVELGKLEVALREMEYERDR